MHEVLVNRLGGLSLSRKSVVRLTDRPDMTLDVYRGRKTTMQQEHSQANSFYVLLALIILVHLVGVVVMEVAVFVVVDQWEKTFLKQ